MTTTEYSKINQISAQPAADNFFDFNAEDQSNWSSRSSNNLQAQENSDLNAQSILSKMRPFKCEFPECHKDYSNKSRLDIHVRTHTGDKPFICELCGKSFNEKGNLKIHNRIHTGEKPYKCSFQGCGKEFKAYGHLSDHLKRHYNIRPFKCEMCHASFSRRNTLKTHIMTHTGEKPHKCSFPGCNKRFSERGNMKTHLKTHNRNSKKKFPCNEINDPEEIYIFNYTSGSLKSAKEFTENSQVQRGSEFFYLGSKTTSSTTVMPLSPKKPKSETDAFNNSTTNNKQLCTSNLLIAEETEYCASPTPNANTASNNMNNNHDDKKDNNNNNIFINFKSNLNNDNNNLSNPTTTAKHFVTKEHYSKKYHSLVQKGQNTNEKADDTSHINNSISNMNIDKNKYTTNNTSTNYHNSTPNNSNTYNTQSNPNRNMVGNCNQALLIGNSASSVPSPHFNYGKFEEATKLNQLGSANSVDSKSTNLINASTSESPVYCNNAACLELKSSCLNTFNSFFTEDFFPKNNFSIGEIFADSDFNLNFKNNGFISNNNSDFFSLDNFLE